MIEALFWVSAFVLLHTYLLYPAILFVWSALAGAGVRPEGGDPPRVSVIIAVFNEQSFVRPRIENILSSDYPADRIEVLVGSDGSTDATNDILASCAGERVRPFIFERRRGKANVLNDLVREARGEVLVFSDANTVFFADAIAELVRPFADPAVGAVTGELVLESGLEGVGGRGEVSYWHFENWMKGAESRIRSTLGATGGIYAIRAELYGALPAGTGVMDDFVIPMNILKKGYVVRYQPSARAFEKAADSVSGEFRRKVRIGASNINGLRLFSGLLHPRYGFVSFALWSHKIFRWFAPFFIIGFVAASLLLAGSSPFHGWMAVLEAVFGALALFGLAAERSGWKVGALGYPYYFLAINAALFIGFFRSLRGRQAPVWEVVR